MPTKPIIPRVLIIEPAGNLWGSERSLLVLLKAIPTSEVAICCPAQSQLNNDLVKMGVLTLPYIIPALHQKSKWQRLRSAIGVLQACLEFQPDVIHLNQSGIYKVVLPAATLLNLPIVAHVRLFEDAAYLASKSPSPRRLRGLIAISWAVDAEIRQFKELQAIPLHTIYNAYAPCPMPLPACPVERRGNRVACVGRLTPIKGQDILIDALGVLNGAGGRAECLMIGSGDECFVQQLKQMACDRKVDSSIHWGGFIPDVVPVLRTCSVLACPSHSEPLGRVIFEAWDAGVVPVVFSGSGGAAEIVAAADAGIIYEEQTPESLASALQEALQMDSYGKTRLINNGRSWMAKNCDPIAHGEAVCAVLANACDLRS